jgi:hypothetical protein
MVVVIMVVEDVEVVGAVVEDGDVAVLVGVERLEDVVLVDVVVGVDEELIESLEVVKDWIKVLEMEDVELEVVENDMVELVESKLVLDLDTEEVLLVENAIDELELNVELVLLTKLLELDPPTGERLLYIDSLDPPPHYYN